MSPKERSSALVNIDDRYGADTTRAIKSIIDYIDKFETQEKTKLNNIVNGVLGIKSTENETTPVVNPSNNKINTSPNTSIKNAKLSDLLDQYFNDWQTQKNNRPSTIKATRQDLDRIVFLLGNKPCNEYSEKDAIYLLQQLKGEQPTGKYLANKTIKEYLGLFKRVCAYGCQFNDIALNYFPYNHKEPQLYV